MNRTAALLLAAFALLPRGAAPVLGDDRQAIDLAEIAGVDATGAKDSTTAIQAAIVQTTSRHKPVRACGTYKLSAPLVFETRDGAHNTGSGIIGCSEPGAAFTSHTQNGIEFRGASFAQQKSCVLRNVSIVSPHGLKTAGSGVYLKNTERCTIEHNTIDGQHDGITADSTALSRIADNFVIGGSADGTAIALRGIDVNSYIVRNSRNGACCAYSANLSRHRPSPACATLTAVWHAALLALRLQGMNSMDRLDLDQIGVLEGTDKSSSVSYGWDYLRHYEEWFAPCQDQPINIIEIGVDNGHSLQMWKGFFSRAQIVGIDINPACGKFADERIAVEIGSQEDPDFLEKV